MKLTIIDFTARNRRQEVAYFKDHFIMKKEAETIITNIAPTAVLHKLRHFDVALVHTEVVSKPGNVEKASEVIIEQEANIPT